MTLASTVDGITFAVAMARLLAVGPNSLVITGTDPLVFTYRNSADDGDVVAHSTPVSSPTGYTASF